MSGKEYISKISAAIGTALIEPDGLYSGRAGHERFARECGYALNDFDLEERKEILASSYSSIYVRGCKLKPILDAREWITLMESQIKA